MLGKAPALPGLFILTSKKLPFLVLSAAILLTALAYSRGLAGGFVFDDYPQIVINENLRSINGWLDISRVIVSGNAGPGGRPLALLTLAAQIAWTGLNPYYFKLFNIIIHLINGLLLFFFLSRLLGAGVRQKSLVLPLGSDVVAALVVAWWLLSPLALTSVLYVIQRMNSLSAMFALAALWGYVWCRQRGVKCGTWNFAALAWLLCFTGLSFFSKESGLLTLGYAWAVEFFVFKGRAASRVWQRVFFIVRASPAIGVAFAVVLYPLWAGMIEYSGRSFTLLERLLTQPRVLWFHIFQILFPNAGSFSLYHDDFMVSRSLFDPLSTLVAIVGHLAMLVLAILMRKRFPLVSLGIVWFYVGHLLESTIFPLEMVFEHRNYLPMIGPLLAIVGIFGNISKEEHKRIAVLSLLLWIIASAFVTAVRADAWGDPLFPIHEAARNPLSSRANYDAGIALLNAVSEDQEWNKELFQRGREYFQRSIETESNGIAALVGLLELNVRVGKRPEEAIFVETERRLSQGIPHANLMFSLLSLHKLVSKDSPFFLDADAERLYLALLSNTRVKGMIRSHAMVAYGLLKGKRGDVAGGLDLLHEAVEETPHINEFRVVYIAALIDQAMYAEARSQLDKLRGRDKFGVFENEIRSLDQQIPPATRSG